MKSNTYFQSIFLLCFFSIIVLGSCQNTEKKANAEENDRTSTNIREVSAGFEANIEVDQEIPEAEMMISIGSFYSRSSSQKDCDCEEKSCFKQSILGHHYFKEDKINKALVIIGNACEGGHATLGWCDVALFEEKEGKWSLNNFFKEIGGGSAFGQSGNLGNIFPIAKKGLGIEIGFGDMAQGQSFEGVNILMYRGGKISNVAKIETHFDNFGDAFEEKDKVCKCQSYSFMPEQEEDVFSLRLVEKQCLNSDDAAACSGEMVKQTTIKFNGEKYIMPTEGIF